MTLADALARVFDNHNCELFRLVDKTCDLGADTAIYLDELARFTIAAAEREGYIIRVEKKP